MSHKASAWLALLPPETVKAGAFRILFHLCDHHNDERDPEFACFPSQETLMRKTGLSNGALNNALKTMEQGGILKRRRSTVPGSSKPRTYYILGCDGPLTAKQTPENGGSPNSSPLEAATEQTPVSEQANSSFMPSKLQSTGEEPVKEPVKEHCAADAAHTSEFDFDFFFAEFQRIYPRMGDAEKTEDALTAAIAAGADPSEILTGAKAYVVENADNKIQYLKFSENWITEKRWTQHVVKPRAAIDPKKILEIRAADIRAAKPYVCRSITAHAAGECIAAGLVSIQQCKSAGIAI